MEKKAFGIDLGTTYSCISYVDEISGDPVVVDNMEGTNVTPSVVYFEDEESYTVGDVAKESSIVSPENTCEFVKRKMGDETSKVAITIGEKDYSPEQISSLILTKLVKDAEEALDTKINDVVITCPAYFGIAERSATENAGKIAGLNVLEIINEPTAAALCYGSLRDVQDKVILVYDLGGGTFDVTIIRVTKEEIIAIATDGDHQLGGKNWDQTLIEHLQDEFCTQKPDFDGEFDLEALQELQLKAEKAKQQLTAKPVTKVIVSASGMKASIELKRETFDDITSVLLKRTIEKTNDAIEAAKDKGVTEIDEIILVGGSCKMPQVKAIIAQEYPNIPIKMFEPNEAVAKGAALHADSLQKGKARLQKWNEIFKEIGGPTLDDLKQNKVSEEQVKEIQEEVEEKGESVEEFKALIQGKISGNGADGPKLKNITSKSFGIQVLVEERMDGLVNRVEKISNLVTKQDSVPVSITKEFGTAYDNMVNVELIVYETDITDPVYDIGMNAPLGTAVLELPSNLPENSPIEVTIDLSTDGLLKLKGFEKSSNNECKATMRSDAILTEEEVESQTVAMQGLILK